MTQYEVIAIAAALADRHGDLLVIQVKDPGLKPWACRRFSREDQGCKAGADSPASQGSRSTSCIIRLPRTLGLCGEIRKGI